MNADLSACASFGDTLPRDEVDWSHCERDVRRLRARIVKATRVGRHNKVKTVQWLLRFRRGAAGRLAAINAIFSPI